MKDAGLDESVASTHGCLVLELRTRSWATVIDDFTDCIHLDPRSTHTKIMFLPQSFSTCPILGWYLGAQIYPRFDVPLSISRWISHRINVTCCSTFTADILALVHRTTRTTSSAGRSSTPSQERHGELLGRRCVFVFCLFWLVLEIVTRYWHVDSGIYNIDNIAYYIYTGWWFGTFFMFPFPYWEQ